MCLICHLYIQLVVMVLAEKGLQYYNLYEIRCVLIWLAQFDQREMGHFYRSKEWWLIVWQII